MTAYKDEKTNTWMARFYYTNWKGERKQKKKRGFEKKKDALAYEADFIAQSQQKPHMTLKALADVFLADYKDQSDQAGLQPGLSLLCAHRSPV